MHTWDRAPLKFTSCLNLTGSRYSHGAKNMYCNVTWSHRFHMVETKIIWNKRLTVSLKSFLMLQFDTSQAVKWWADIRYPICHKQNIFGSLPGPVEVGAPVITIGAADVPGGVLTNGLVHPLAGPAMLTWEVKCIQHIPKWQQILYSFVFTTITTTTTVYLIVK